MKTNNKTKAKSTTEASNNKSSKITLASHQDVSIISNLHGRLKKCAARQVDVNVMAEKVESIDTATLQLLTSFVQQIRHNGNNVNWQSTSSALLDSARLIDLEEAMFFQQTNE